MPNVLGIAALVVVVLGCASAGNIPVVQSEYWKNENFREWESYGWLPSDAHLRATTQPEDHRLHDLIPAAIDKRLATKGLELRETRDVDFLVTYHCRIAEELQVDVIDRVWYGGAGDEGDWEEVTRRIELSSFAEGSIVIDFVRPEDGKRMWRGVAKGRVSADATSEQLRKIVDRSVYQILGEFPPGD